MDETYVSENDLLIIEIKESAEKVTFNWKGKSTGIDPAKFLGPIFDKHLFNNQKIIEMDFLELEYLTSSTVTPMIRLLERIKNSSRSMKIFYDRDVDWQVKVFSALRVFSHQKHILISGITKTASNNEELLPITTYNLRCIICLIHRLIL